MNPTPETQLAVAPQAPPSILSVLSAAVQGGITADNVAVVKELLALRREEEAAQAAKDFASAFCELQKETPRIKATKAVPDNSGNVRYTFAPYEEIMRQVHPMLAKHGFSVSFDTSFDDKRVNVTCHLMHRGGHMRSNTFACRIGSGPPKASEAQSDGAATTYAKRFALVAALNITVEGMDADGADPKVEGAPVSPELANKLRSDCLDAGMDLAKVCKWLGVASFTEIPESKVAILTAKIAEKIAAKQP